MHELSKRYMEGDGVEKDLAGVMDWMEKAALLGDAEAENTILDREILGLTQQQCPMHQYQKRIINALIV